MEIDSGPIQGEGNKNDEHNGKQIIVMLVGAPGSGKSTFCDNVIRSSSRPWARICQDIINNGKSGTKPQCLNSAANALKEGKSIFIDRCNLDREQRADFIKLGSSKFDLHAVVLDLPAKLCISRCVKRTDHEGKLQGGKAAAVVNRMLQKKELPKLSEGYCRITYCQSENDVKDAVNAYSTLGLTDNLPSGYFGQKSPVAKVQVGIMKFMKKLDQPSKSIPDVEQKHSLSPTPKKMRLDDVLEAEPVGVGIPSEAASIDIPDTPTLAFPSISTADFQFDYEKASEIIVEKVQECLGKHDNIKLVMVDLSHRSRILSLVKAKAAAKKVDSNRFCTFVGDITQLHSVGGLRCNVIANAANWRLKPGGGGVNAAIYSAAGPALEAATKKQAGNLSPGKAIVVPLPSSSPLYSREGVTHVIHVLGPNMNPQRPNYLNGDYGEGCRVLQNAYSSLFESFISIVEEQSTVPLHKHEKLQSSETIDPANSKVSPQKNKMGASKTWGSWAQALYNIAVHPEKYKNDIFEVTNDVVVLNDAYPKAKKHVLVLARLEGLDRLADVSEEHLHLLRTMHEVGIKWAKKFLQDDESLIFRLGYHSVPSMRQLHLHVISQDFESPHLKNKKHWNSFNTAFFFDSVDVIEEVSKNGKASVNGDDRLLSMELRCNRCRSAHPNLPRLKSHIRNCQAEFPAKLLEGDRLVQATK
ncbi:uncharacterized protein [Phyllobates terribilis]|uniref:uncharacterized protein n=1 Tax=Phyllobates terribilis TaxID=111132 RepID=UPI003CCB5602